MTVDGERGWERRKRVRGNAVRDRVNWEERPVTHKRAASIRSTLETRKGEWICLGKCRRHVKAFISFKVALKFWSDNEGTLLSSSYSASFFFCSSFSCSFLLPLSPSLLSPLLLPLRYEAAQVKHILLLGSGALVAPPMCSSLAITKALAIFFYFLYTLFLSLSISHSSHTTFFAPWISEKMSRTTEEWNTSIRSFSDWPNSFLFFFFFFSNELHSLEKKPRGIFLSWHIF